MRNKYEGLISELNGNKANESLEKQLAQIKDHNLKLEQENKKLKSQVNFYEWKNNNQKPQQGRNECPKCQNLLMTNSRLLGKLKKLTTSGLSKDTATSRS